MSRVDRLWDDDSESEQAGVTLLRPSGSVF